MKILAVILLLLFFNSRTTFADDDFDGYDSLPENNRKVVMHESAFSKKVSLFSIKLFIEFNRYFLRPVTVAYKAVTSNNFRESLDEGLDNFYDVGNSFNNIAVFSPQRLLASFGYVLTNSSFGILGTVNICNKMKIEQNRTQFVDIFRFYGMQEGYFIVIFFFFPIPFTLTTTLQFALENVRATYYSPAALLNSNHNIFERFVINTIPMAVNTYAFNIDTLDALIKLDPNLIYSSMKDNTYAKAKYFTLNRTPFPPKKRTLLEYIEMKDKF